MTIDKEQLRDRARGRWREIVLALTSIPAQSLDGKNHACPLCHDGTDRFAVFDDFDQTGGANCRHCHSTENGDGFALLGKANGWSFTETLERVAEYLGASPAPQVRPQASSKPASDIADADTRHRVYNALLDALSLSPDHEAMMLQRGFTKSDLDRCKYRTLPANVSPSIPSQLFQQFGEVVKLVPGIRPSRIHGAPGTIIPCLDRHGRIVALKSRADHIEPGQPRYTSLSSAKLRPAGPKAEAAVHVPAGTPAQCDLVRITEGEVKADVAFALSQLATLGLPGVNSWRKALPIIAELGAKTIRLSFDADHRTNKNVAECLLRNAMELVRTGHEIELETWLESSGKGIDNVLADGHAATITITRGREALAAIQANALALGIEIKGDAEPVATTARDAHEITNATFETTTNDEGQEESKIIPLPVGEIVKRIYTATDGWPRSCEGGLFVDDPKHGGISWLKNPASLFGYLGSVVGRINWFRAVGYPGCIVVVFSPATPELADVHLLESN